MARHSTTEVHPKFSEAPRLRTSIPRPKNGLQQKSKRIAANVPMALVFKTLFFEIKIGVKELRLSETKIAEMCYLYRITGLMAVTATATS